MVPIAAIAATYEKQASDSDILLTEAEPPATFKNAYLLISNRVDMPNDAAIAYVKRWRIEVFYRTAKQNFGLIISSRQTVASIVKIDTNSLQLPKNLFQVRGF